MTRARDLARLSNRNILSIDSANQRVGIGTILPEYPLHVVGVASTSLFVDGSARITGILSIGQGTVTVDGNTNTLTASNIVVENSLISNSGVSYATTEYVDSGLSTKISAIGIQSAGISIASTITTLNFVGSGNTFAVNGNTVDISISGGSGGGGSIGIQSAGARVATGITDLDIAIGSTTSRNIVASGSTATVSVDLGDYYIFRKPEVGFATMKVLVAGSQGGIAYSDYVGGSVYTGMTTTNTDQFPWVAGIAITIAPNGHLTLTVP